MNNKGTQPNIYMYPFSPKSLFHPGHHISGGIEWSSICYTIGFCWLPILNIAMCPNYPFPLATISSFSKSMSLKKRIIFIKSTDNPKRWSLPLYISEGFNISFVALWIRYSDHNLLCFLFCFNENIYVSFSLHITSFALNIFCYHCCCCC